MIIMGAPLYERSVVIAFLKKKGTKILLDMMVNFKLPHATEAVKFRNQFISSSLASFNQAPPAQNLSKRRVGGERWSVCRTSIHYIYFSSAVAPGVKCGQCNIIPSQFIKYTISILRPTCQKTNFSWFFLTIYTHKTTQ